MPATRLAKGGLTKGGLLSTAHTFSFLRKRKPVLKEKTQKNLVKEKLFAGKKFQQEKS